MGRPPDEPPELELLELELELALLELALLALDEPPVEVEVEPPEVEVEPPEVEVDPPDVEVEPPEVETVIVVLPPVELPPTKLPLKKPAPKPLPKPPPPITIGTAPPALLATATGGGGGGGTNIGGTMVRVVVTCGAAGAAQATRRTVRRTTRRLAWERRTVVPVAVRAFAWLTMDGRGGGFSARLTAPPPMIAPPQVQAQSFARAILTDITSILFLAGLNEGLHQYSCAAWPCGQMQSRGVRGKRVNHLVPRNGRVLGRRRDFRPNTEHDRVGSERPGRSTFRATPADSPDPDRIRLGRRRLRALDRHAWSQLVDKFFPPV